MKTWFRLEIGRSLFHLWRHSSVTSTQYYKKYDIFAILITKTRKYVIIFYNIGYRPDPIIFCHELRKGCPELLQNFNAIRPALRGPFHYYYFIHPPTTMHCGRKPPPWWPMAIRNFGWIQVSVNCESTKLFETCTGMSESTKLFETNIGMIWFFRNVPLFKAKLRGFHDSIKYAPLPQNISSMQCHIVRRSFAGSYIDYASKCYL